MPDAPPRVQAVIRFAVIDGDNRLLRFGKCAEETLANQAGPGESATEVEQLPVIIPGRRYIVVGGEVIEVPD